MSRHFLLYWRPETVEQHLGENYLLNHAGSNQLGQLLTGDVLWIATTGEAGELGIAGRLMVGKVVNLYEAERRLKRRDLWNAHFHALAKPGTAERMRGVSLFEYAHKLYFIDDGNPSLAVRNGCVDPNELKRMRRLSFESARLLNQIWVFSKGVISG